jgi:hypothetical protein
MQSVAHRWFGVGQSHAPNSAKAGAEAAAEALKGRDPAVIFVFASVVHDLPLLLGAVRAEAGHGPPIVGCTTIGELGSAGMSEGGVAIAAIGGDGFTVHTRVAQIDKLHPREAGAAAAEALHGLHDENRVLILFCEGLTGKPHEIVRGAYSAAGATVPIVGGFAGDDRRFRQTHQFYGTEALTNAVVGVALGSDGPLGIGVGHGWRRIEPPMMVTRSQGAHIYELDDRPALDVLQERNQFVGTAAEFFGPHRALQPLGLSRRSGEDIRVLHAGDDAERSVWGNADVPQGALVWPMEADRQALLDGATTSCRDALSQLDGLPPLGVLAFDCGGRREGLVNGGSGLDDEIAAIRTGLGGAPFAGLYTLGEIARTRGALGMHHLTLVTLAMA